MSSSTKQIASGTTSGADVRDWRRADVIKDWRDVIIDAGKSIIILNTEVVDAEFKYRTAITARRAALLGSATFREVDKRIGDLMRAVSDVMNLSEQRRTFGAEATAHTGYRPYKFRMIRFRDESFVEDKLKFHVEFEMPYKPFHVISESRELAETADNFGFGYVPDQSGLRMQLIDKNTGIKIELSEPEGYRQAP